jgi:hypothetical protein
VTWIKLQRGNDWGTEYLAIQALDDRGFASRRRSVPLKEGAQVRVRWPDGTTETLSVVMKTFRGTVSDMGHDSPTRSELPGVHLSSRGMHVWVCLDEVEVLLEDVEPKASYP